MSSRTRLASAHSAANRTASRPSISIRLATARIVVQRDRSPVSACTAELVRQILGAVSQFEKAALVAKLRHAREGRQAVTGRCEGRKPVSEAAIAEARKLARKSPKTGKRRSLRAIAAELAALGHLGPTGRPYHAGSVRHMLAG